MRRLIVKNSDLSRNPVLRELMDPDHSQISATGSFYVITDQHPNLSVILLALSEPIWWPDTAVDFRLMIDRVKHEPAQARVQTFI
jgi:hypothetical protein